MTSLPSTSARPTSYVTFEFLAVRSATTTRARGVAELFSGSAYVSIWACRHFRSIRPLHGIETRRRLWGLMLAYMPWAYSVPTFLLLAEQGSNDG